MLPNVIRYGTKQLAKLQVVGGGRNGASDSWRPPESRLGEPRRVAATVELACFHRPISPMDSNDAKIMVGASVRLW